MEKERFAETGNGTFLGDYLYERVVPQVKYLERKAAKSGFQLVPAQAVSESAGLAGFRFSGASFRLTVIAFGS